MLPDFGELLIDYEEDRTLRAVARRDAAGSRAVTLRRKHSRCKASRSLHRIS
jgi:hypothetical protein